MDCMVALPGQLFYSHADPGLPLVPRPRTRRTARFRDRRGETLFIDARKLGTLVDRVHRELTDEDIATHRRHLPRLARRQGRRRVRRRARLLQSRDARGDPQARLRPHARPLRRRGRGRGRHGTVEDKMKRLVAMLSDQMQESQKLNRGIADNLHELGYECP